MPPGNVSCTFLSLVCSFPSLSRGLAPFRPVQMISQTFSIVPTVFGEHPSTGNNAPCNPIEEHHDRMNASPVYRKERMAPLTSEWKICVLAASPHIATSLSQRLKTSVSCRAATLFGWTPTIWAFPGISGYVRREGNDRGAKSKAI